jgi:hypothetical protein
MVRCAGTLIIVDEFKAADYLKIAARERVTQTVMVPAMYNLCLLQADFDSTISRRGGSEDTAARRCRSRPLKNWLPRFPA